MQRDAERLTISCKVFFELPSGFVLDVRGLYLEFGIQIPCKSVHVAFGTWIIGPIAKTQLFANRSQYQLPTWRVVILEIYLISVVLHICRSIHAISTATAYCCSAIVNCLPAGIWCHLLKQPRQQQPVACWAMNTGWPRMGVCLPSFGISAGASLRATKSSACWRIVVNPFEATYSLSFAERRKRLRKEDLESLTNKSVRS